MNKWVKLIMVDLFLIGLFLFLSLTVELGGAGYLTALLILSFGAQYAFHHIFEKDKE